MENTIEIPKISANAAHGILGTGGNTDIVHTHKCYQALIWTAQENDELTVERMQELSLAWRLRNQCDVIKQIGRDGKFVLDIHFDDQDKKTCDACGGAGERFKFAKKPVQVECLKCKTVQIKINDRIMIIEGTTITLNGKDISDHKGYQKYLGKVVDDCPSCDGDGRYITEDPEFGGKNNLACRTCRGINIDGLSEVTQVISKCKTCKGKREVKIPVISPEIKSTTLCRKCSGLGYTIPRPEQQPMNPVINPDLASALKQL